MSPRNLSHFDTLLKALQLEWEEEQSRLRRMRAELTIKQRVRLGIALGDAQAVDESYGLGSRFVITFQRAGKLAIEANFEAGYVVEVWPRQAIEGSGTRAVVVHCSTDALKLAFETVPSSDVREQRVFIELAANASTFERMRRAVQTISAYDRGADRRRRDMLLGNAAPRFEVVKSVDFRLSLNALQQSAVEQALAASDVFLVHGPPGCGKSTVLAEVVWQTVGRGEVVCVSASSNAAVDHMLDLCVSLGLKCIRIGHPARVIERLHAYTLDVLVESHEDTILARELLDEAYELKGYARKQRDRGRSRERFAQARDAKHDAQALFNEARELQRRATSRVLADAQVIFVTCASLESHALSSMQFETLVLDEATQATEPLSLMGFVKAKRVIMAGDHCQLSPTVLSQDASRLGLSVSLFERLTNDYEGITCMLAEQYRMHEAIMGFASREMYQDKLRAHPSVAHHTLSPLLTKPLDVSPLMFLDTAGKGYDEIQDESTQSYCNPGEAVHIQSHALKLLEHGLLPNQIGIIAPYRAQVMHMREELATQVALGLEIDTVDAFQGREKEAILLTLTRSNAVGQIGFLSDLRRMNVAITRARRHLYVVGDSATVATQPFYSRFIDEVQAQSGYQSAWDAEA